MINNVREFLVDLPGAGSVLDQDLVVWEDRLVIGVLRDDGDPDTNRVGYLYLQQYTVSGDPVGEPQLAAESVRSTRLELDVDGDTLTIHGTVPAMTGQNIDAYRVPLLQDGFGTPDILAVQREEGEPPFAFDNETTDGDVTLGLGGNGFQQLITAIDGDGNVIDQLDAERGSFGDLYSSDPNIDDGQRWIFSYRDRDTDAFELREITLVDGALVSTVIDIPDPEVASQINPTETGAWAFARVDTSGSASNPDAVQLQFLGYGESTAAQSYVVTPLESRAGEVIQDTNGDDFIVRENFQLDELLTREDGTKVVVVRVVEQFQFADGSSRFKFAIDGTETRSSHLVATFDSDGTLIGEVAEAPLPDRGNFSFKWDFDIGPVDEIVASYASPGDNAEIIRFDPVVLTTANNGDGDGGNDGDESDEDPEIEIIRGTQGDDLIFGRGSDAIIYGYKGNDELRGGAGDDDMRAGSGDDELRGNKGDDTLKGNGGNDSLRGDGGDDRLSGGNGDDLVRGNDGDDYASGDSGDDRLWGGKGFDQLFGGTGDDVIDGGKDDDLIDGGADNDVLIGGRGDDIFRFDAGDGSDVIKDFGKGADKIDLVGYEGEGLEGLFLSQDESTAIIEWEGTRIALEKTDIEDISEDVII